MPRRNDRASVRPSELSVEYHQRFQIQVTRQSMVVLMIARDSDNPEVTFGEVDFHGHSRKEAQRATLKAIEIAREVRGLTHLILITGIGRHSDGGKPGKPRLQPLVQHLLEEMVAKKRIKAFQQINGGGAFQVFLHRR